MCVSVYESDSFTISILKSVSIFIYQIYCELRLLLTQGISRKERLWDLSWRLKRYTCYQCRSDRRFRFVSHSQFFGIAVMHASSHITWHWQDFVALFEAWISVKFQIQSLNFVKNCIFAVLWSDCRPGVQICSVRESYSAAIRFLFCEFQKRTRISCSDLWSHIVGVTSVVISGSCRKRGN